MRGTLLLVAGLVLGLGCKSKSAVKKDDAAASAVPADAAATIDAMAIDAAVADAAVAAIADAPPGALVAGPDGVGPITKDTAYDVKALKKLLPDHAVKKQNIKMGEGDLADVFIGVSKGKTLVLKIAGQSDVSDIDIVDNSVWNPFGLTIGMTLADAEKRVGKLECSSGGEHTDWKADVAECGNDKTPRYTLDFQHEEGVEAEELIKDAKRLAQAKLVALRWSAPGYGPPGTE